MEYSKYNHDRARLNGAVSCVFAGMRITVQDVLEHLAGGMTGEEIFYDSPELTREDIRACISFAANR